MPKTGPLEYSLDSHLTICTEFSVADVLDRHRRSALEAFPAYHQAIGSIDLVSTSADPAKDTIIETHLSRVSPLVSAAALASPANGLELFPEKEHHKLSMQLLADCILTFAGVIAQDAACANTPLTDKSIRVEATAGAYTRRWQAAPEWQCAYDGYPQVCYQATLVGPPSEFSDQPLKVSDGGVDIDPELSGMNGRTYPRGTVVRYLPTTAHRLPTVPAATPRLALSGQLYLPDLY